MADKKKVTLEIAVNLVDDEVKKLESELSKIDNKNIDIETTVDKSSLDATKNEADQIDGNSLDMKTSVDNKGLDEVKSKKKDIEEDDINLKIDTTNAMLGLQTIRDGLAGLKASIQEIGQQFNQVMSSAGKYETNLAYLANNMGLDAAKTKMEEINDIVAKLPGDDTAIGGILSSAAARDSSLTKDNLESIAASAADYMAAMSYYGKTATEAQQDMTNYILTGNTAEIERSPILSSHIDKLKQAKTIQERQKVLAEALNEEGWGGMSQADTYNNKLETFNGMLERGRQNLGLIFMQGSKGAMDFLINLDGATGGMIGLTAAAFGFLEPVGQGLISIGQMGQGLKTLGVNGENLRKLGGHLKDIGSSALNAAKGLAEAGKAALVAGANALKSAGMWMAEKIQILASTVAKGAAAIASYALAIAEWLLASPILLIVIAIVALIAILWYLYNTNESVRNAIDGLAQALWGLGESIYGGIAGAIQWLIDGFTWLWETITGLFNGTGAEGINWLTTMIMVLMGPIGWIMLLIQNWDSIGPAVSGALSSMYQNAVNWFNQTGEKIHNFASDLVSSLGSAASNGVSSFASGISNLGQALRDELNGMLDDAANFVGEIGQTMWNAAVNAWNQFLAGLERHSPGIMMREFNAEMTGIIQYAKDTETPLGSAMRDVGNNAVSNFNPNFNLGSGTSGIDGAGTVINNEFNFTFTDFIDDKERLTDLIVKTITDEINWDNNTAGRNV